MKKWSDIYSKEQMNQYRRFKKISEYSKYGASLYYSSGQIREKVFSAGLIAICIALVVGILLVSYLGKKTFEIYFDQSYFWLGMTIGLSLYFVLMPNLIGNIYRSIAKSGTKKALLLLRDYPLYTPESKAAYKQLQADIVNLPDEEALSAWVAAESSNMKYMKANEKLKKLYLSEKKDILDRKLL